MKCVLLIVALFSSGCALPEASLRRADNFQIEVTDSPTERRFYIRLLVTGEERICFPNYQWPSRLGHVDVRGTNAFVTTESGRFPANERDFGYCVGEGCEIRLSPGESLRAFVSYDEFPPAANLDSSSARRLEFRPNPHVC